MKTRKLIALAAVLSAFVAIGNIAPAVAATDKAAIGRLGGLTELVLQRIEVGDLVAASKFGTDRPIEDPVREQQVLDSARQSAIELGLDQDETVQFFRDQIEASKVVQRGLFQRWTAHPSEAPTTRPDLNEIRIELDELGKGMLAELVKSTAIRHAGLGCVVELSAARVSVTVVHRLDRLHSRALGGGLDDVCVRGRSGGI